MIMSMYINCSLQVVLSSTIALKKVANTYFSLCTVPAAEKWVDLHHLRICTIPLLSDIEISPVPEISQMAPCVSGLF